MVFSPNVSEISYELWLWYAKTSVSQTAFPSLLFVIGPEGGVCKVEDQSVWLGTTEPGAQHLVPAARQTSFWCASPGMCLCGKWPLLPTCPQPELACIQSWPASPGVRYIAPLHQNPNGLLSQVVSLKRSVSQILNFWELHSYKEQLHWDEFTGDSVAWAGEMPQTQLSACIASIRTWV